MLFNPNIHTEAQVLRILASAMEAMEAGQQVVAWSNEGSSATLQNSRPVDEVIKECEAFLQVLNPRKYGYRVKKASGYGRS